MKAFFTITFCLAVFVSHAQCKINTRVEDRINKLKSLDRWSTWVEQKVEVSANTANAYDFNAEPGYWYEAHIIVPKPTDELVAVLSKGGNVINKGSSSRHNEAACNMLVTSPGTYQVAFTVYGRGRHCATILIMRQKKR